MNLFEAIIIAIVEGLTEFLPVSSTGHMMIASAVMGMEQNDFVKLYIVAIQLGAILSVVVIYWKRFFQTVDFYIKLLIAFIPAVIFGILLGDAIDLMLEKVEVVGLTLLLGGIVFLFIDDWFKKNNDLEQKPVSNKNAFVIGFFQVIAMIPGVSRSAATIIGGLTQGLNKKNAAEFSFFLAVPTMFAATAKKLYDYTKDAPSFSLTNQEWLLLLVGNLVAFVVAYLAINSFIRFLTTKGFKAFGYYRIIVGVIILTLWWMNIPLNII